MHVVKMYNRIKVLCLIELIEVVVQIQMYKRILKIYKTNNSYRFISNKFQILYHLQWLKIFPQLQIYILHNKINNPPKNKFIKDKLHKLQTLHNLM